MKRLAELKKKGCELRISCFWESVSGNGGPILDHVFLHDLSKLAVDLNFDVWFTGEAKKKG